MRYTLVRGPSIRSERGIIGHITSSISLNNMSRAQSRRSPLGSPKVRMDFNHGMVDIVFPPVSFDGYTYRRNIVEDEEREQLQSGEVAWRQDGNGIWAAASNENEQTKADERQSSQPSSKPSSKRSSTSSFEVEFVKNARFYGAFSALVALAMMVGLHGTAASSALPVSQLLVLSFQ